MNGGDTIFYYLIVASEIQIDWDMLTDLEEAIKDDTSNTISNYDYKTIDATFPSMKCFKLGGTAIFTHPNTPVKCSGAPMKIFF